MQGSREKNGVFREYIRFILIDLSIDLLIKYIEINLLLITFVMKN